MTFFRQNLFTRFLPAFLLAILCVGCTEGVDPFVGDERPFTLWGYMDAGSDTQMVRVFTIEERLGLDRSGPIDAVVTSIDLDTGERRTWRDSVVVFEGIGAGHVFWSDFRAQHEHRYRLEVRRSDGATSSVEVNVPPPATLTFDERTVSPVTRVEVRSAAPNIVGVQVVYAGVPAYPLHPWPGTLSTPPIVLFPVSIPYDDKVTRTPDGWSFDLDMTRDFTAVQFAYVSNCLPKLILLRDVEIRFLVADSTWAPPGGRFDPDVLVEPNAFSNVENGFGFFGAGHTVSYRWIPASALQAQVGFALGAPCAMATSPACVIESWPCFQCDTPLTPSIRRHFCSPGTRSAGLRRITEAFPTCAGAAGASRVSTHEDFTSSGENG